VRGAAAAFLLAAVELAAGTFALMWVSKLIWSSIDRGHFRATTWVLAPITVAIAIPLSGRARVAGLVAAALMALFLGAVYLEQTVLETLSGAAASLIGIAAVVFSGLSACDVECGVGVVHALVGLVFLGAVTHGMILGHWYLNQPRLEIAPLKGSAWIIFGTIAVAFVAGLATRAVLLTATVRANVLAVSAAGYWWVWLMLLAGTLLLVLMVRSTVAIRSTQSATGLLYIAMIPALGAQFLINLLVAS
jgi:hypothetical protein